uniref:Uncharacterized protein n=1 Tax=Chenopodium quinoa TaxID=63459 RepID=A0A803N8W6_CHEQI
SRMHANTGKANEAELCTPLTSMEEREAYYRHMFLADAEKALRPTNHDIPEDTEIADVEPISVQYHLRSNLDLFNQYDTNIDRMPRTKHTSYQREVGESSRHSVDEEDVDPGHKASDIREEDIRSVEDSLERQESGGESIGNEDDAEGSEILGEGGDDEEEDDETDEEIRADFNLAAQRRTQLPRKTTASMVNASTVYLTGINSDYQKKNETTRYGPTERVTKPRTLAVKRGGGNASKRTSESSDREPQKKQKKHDGDTAPLHQKSLKTWPEGVVNLEDETDPHPAKKLTITLRDPKSLGVSSEVRTGQMASIENPPSKETTVVSGRTGGPSKNAFVPALVGDFIEIPHVRIPEEVAEELAIPFGVAGDPWHPRIDVNRGESVLSDDPSTGGSMGWRMLKDLATPADRPANRVAAPCGQLMNNMLRHYQRAADKAETKLKKADDACKLVIKERDKVKSDIKTLQKQVSDLNKKLTDQEQLQKKVASLEQSLKDEREAKAKLAGRVEEMERDKPGIRRRTVNWFLQTDLYANLLVDRYTAGWVSAHCCVCKDEGSDSAKWQAVEKAFNEEMNHSPTSYESKYFDELPPHYVITNLDPRELREVEFDDALINSPVTTHAGKDGSAGPSNKETVKEPVNAAETTTEADKN